MAVVPLCEDPQIIVNPNLQELIIKCACYSVPNRGVVNISPRSLEIMKYDFPYGRFSKKTLRPTIETLDDFQIIDKQTGEIYPMFIAVPCNHCIICNSKKASEWSFRALCESVSYPTLPYFVTLTYNNLHKPKDGVNKRDVQLFMKRLRISLDRLGIDHDIRYFICSEYGRKTHRPHYHAIFWNWPKDERFNCVTKVERFVSKCWQNGFTYVLPCNKGGINYVMKYMRKKNYVPDGQNPTFFLSSRKNGGIGSAYAREKMDFYRKHPECTEISVKSVFDGSVKTIILPSYFRDIFFPCVSRLIPKFIRDGYKQFGRLVSQSYSLDRSCCVVPLASHTVGDCSRISTCYSFLPDPFARVSFKSDIRRFSVECFLAAYGVVASRVTYFFTVLKEFAKKIDRDLIDLCKQCRDRFNVALNLKMSGRKPIDVKVFADSLRREDIRCLHREIF